MKKLKLAPEIAEWLTRHPKHHYSRSHAQQEGDILRYYHPCGHTSWESWEPSLRALLPHRWVWNRGGVHCTCPRCHKVKRAEYKKQNRPFLPVKNLTRVGPDWEIA